MTTTATTAPVSTGGWSRISRLDVDAVNIVLMLVAAAAAFVAPVETFLFAYAVLGPLHYLTEIGWLHQRSYYLPHRIEAVPLVVLGVVAAALNWHWLEGDNWAVDTGKHATAIALVLAVAFVVVRNRWLALATVVPAYVVARLLRRWDDYGFWIVYLIPTLLHVFVFTLLFMVFGALKANKRLGLVSAGAMVAIGIATFAFRPGTGHVAGASAMNAYSNVNGLNVAVLNHFRLASVEALATDTVGTVFHSSVGVALLRFIAFAYTYHYLNWFSKTKVIHWHRVPKSWLAVVAVGWIAAVAIYAQSYARGLKFLFLLSYAHVLLELPLNVRSIGGIGKELWARRPGRAAT